MDKSPEQLLHYLNPHQHTSDAVISSVRAEQRLTGRSYGNAEQKIGAYLLRLEKVAGRPELSRRLAGAAIENALTRTDDVPENHWERLMELARDEGHDFGDTRETRIGIIEGVQDIQRNGLSEWLGYLQECEDYYPMWFKVYAMQNVMKLGSFDRDSGVYQRRSRGTVAPYPSLNYSALLRTYETIVALHGNTKKLDGDTALLAIDGNFSKIYSHFVLEDKRHLPLPESPDDVNGEWHHHGLKDAAIVAKAAEGTGWCIADQTVAHKYLKESGEFHLFHLRDKETGAVSDGALASVRTVNGMVVEVSGVKGRTAQIVDDVLLDTVVEKVISLPGGDKYYYAKQDKEKLTAMDRKYAAGEVFTIDELRFLYAVDRPIVSLNRGGDSRVRQFRKHRDDHEKQFVAEYGKTGVVMVMEPFEVKFNMEKLLKNGIDANVLVRKLDDGINYFEDGLFRRLLENGADATLLISKADPIVTARHLKELRRAGAFVDEDTLLDNLKSTGLVHAAGDLLRGGVPVEKIITRLPLVYIRSEYRRLIASGIDATIVAHRLTAPTIVSSLPYLIDNGADIDANELVSYLTPIQIASQLPLLMTIGADIDTTKLLNDLPADQAIKYLKQLYEAGVSVNVHQVVARVRPKYRKTLWGWLKAAGENPQEFDL